MICRKQNIRPDADEISMMLSLGVPDVHRRFNRLYDELSVYPGATKIPFTEEELINYFAKTWFGEWSEGWRDKLATWAVGVGFRRKYIYRSAEHQYDIFLSERLATRPGRPQEKDSES
jgi:hypothetical protein